MLPKEECEKLNKHQLIQIYMDLQEQVQSSIEINERLDTLNAKIDQIRSELIVSKKVNDLLCTKVKDLEVRLAQSEQYSRRECLELAGIPKSVKQEDLEPKVLNIFKEIDVVIDPKDVEACHRVGKFNRVIIKLSKRKDVSKVLSNKRKLKDIDPQKFGIDEDKKIYINESLCSAYRKLWSMCKQLHAAKKIQSFFTSNGCVKIKLLDDQKNSILHEDDLKDLFPDFVFAKKEEV